MGLAACLAVRLEALPRDDRDLDLARGEAKRVAVGGGLGFLGGGLGGGHRE